ncbi:MAG: hypothetical protein ABI406_14625, partial [Ktedonobacteraceae bacterium]
MSQNGDEQNRRGALSDNIRASKPYQPKANPDDPLVRRPPRGPRGPLPGPNYIGLAGRTAIVQGQVFLVAVILIAQLWLITDALYELLSGHAGTVGWLALVSFLGFVLALIITF